MLKTERMDRLVIRKFASFDAMKADEYRYWQSRPAYERFAAVEEMIRDRLRTQGLGVGIE